MDYFRQLLKETDKYVLFILGGRPNDPQWRLKLIR